jgi:GTP-binding protein EngB required for normal cell division
VGPMATRRVSGEYEEKLVIAFYGAVSSGKTSAIKVLFSVDPGPIHPIPGTTKHVSVISLPAGLSVADTPGLQDINAEFVTRASQFIDNADIFVYLINANGGITEGVRKDIELLKSTRRPLLILLNKIDTIPPAQREEFVAHQREVAGFPKQDSRPSILGLFDENELPPFGRKALYHEFHAVAFDPLPAVSVDPINIDVVRRWIDRTVQAQGERLLKLKRSASESSARGFLDKFLNHVVYDGVVTLTVRDTLALWAQSQQMKWNPPTLQSTPQEKGNIFVGNLPYSCTEEPVRELFESFGEVRLVTVVTDAFTGESRGFGFVLMPNKQEMDRAIENLNGSEFRGRMLKVDKAR